MKFCSVTPKCRGDSKPHRCVQQQKLLKVAQNPTNGDKQLNEAFKQFYDHNLFKISFKYTQGMLSNRKICLNIFNISKYENFCVF